MTLYYSRFSGLEVLLVGYRIKVPLRLSYSSYPEATEAINSKISTEAGINTLSQRLVYLLTTSEA